MFFIGSLTPQNIYIFFIRAYFEEKYFFIAFHPHFYVDEIFYTYTYFHIFSLDILYEARKIFILSIIRVILKQFLLRITFIFFASLKHIILLFSQSTELSHCQKVHGNINFFFHSLLQSWARLISRSAHDKASRVSRIALMRMRSVCLRRLIRHELA